MSAVMTLGCAECGKMDSFRGLEKWCSANDLFCLPEGWLRSDPGLNGEMKVFCSEKCKKLHSNLTIEQALEEAFQVGLSFAVTLKARLDDCKAELGPYERSLTEECLDDFEHSKSEWPRIKKNMMNRVVKSETC